MKFKNVTMQISKDRWNVFIEITHKDGRVESYVASADSYFTDMDGIWFDTKEEYIDW